MTEHETVEWTPINPEESIFLSKAIITHRGNNLTNQEADAAAFKSLGRHLNPENEVASNVPTCTVHTLDSPSPFDPQGDNDTRATSRLYAVDKLIGWHDPACTDWDCPGTFLPIPVEEFSPTHTSCVLFNPSRHGYVDPDVSSFPEAFDTFIQQHPHRGAEAELPSDVEWSTANVGYTIARVQYDRSNQPYGTLASSSVTRFHHPKCQSTVCPGSADETAAKKYSRLPQGTQKCRPDLSFNFRPADGTLPG
ncbi:hypothetical protein L204_106213 [Cryptococcus depauperatus]|nr:hypothetical protein L204_05774 [Cryptococcus depauperatus CBS 7855]